MAADSAVLDGLDTSTATVDSPADSLPDGPQSTSTADFDFVDPIETIGDAPAGGKQTAPAPEPEETELAEEPTTESPAEPEAPEFDDALVADGQRYGWDAERVKKFGSPEAARLAMAELDRQAALWGKQFVQGQQGDQQGSQQTNATAGQQQTTAQQQAAQQALIEKYQLKAKAEDWDAEVLAEFNGLNEHYHNLLNKQRAEFEELRNVALGVHENFQHITRSQQQAEAERVTREVDTYFESLGPEYQEIYGKGSISSLDPNSPQFKARQQFFVEAQGLEYADQVARRSPQPVSELLDRVRRSRHTDLIQESTRKEIAAKLEKRNKQAIDRPTGAHTRPKTADEAALSFLRAAVPKLKA